MTGPFCKDCKHYIAATVGVGKGCNTPALCEVSAKPSLIDGSLSYTDCKQMRVWPCDAGGKLFEPAPTPEPKPAPLPWWRRVFA